MPEEPSSARNPTRSAASPPPVPDHELLRVIGEGSYGEVWLARNVMGTFRAVKLIYRRNFDNPRPLEREFSGIQRFEPISRLHEELIDILQVGRNNEEGFFYYVMELADDDSVAAESSAAVAASALVEGRRSPLPGVRPSDISPATYRPRTLASELERRGRLPPAECVPLFLSLASAVNHLHQHGLIHRDIKPSNIIFVHGVAKIADIGLVSEAGRLGSYVGTEGYVPPEGAGTAQADLFSLGKVFYELATGRDRSEFPSLPIESVPPGELKLLLELNAIISKACEGDVRHRYRSASELHAELALLESGRSVKRLHTVERRLAHATRLGIVAVVLLMLTLSAYLFSERQRRLVRESLERAEAERTRAEKAEQVVRASADTTEKLWSAYLGHLQAGHLSGQRRQRLESLRALAQAAAIRSSLELRNEAIVALGLMDLRQIQTVRLSGRAPDWLAFDPNLERCLALERGILHLYRAAEVPNRTNAQELLQMSNVLSGPVLAVFWGIEGRQAAVVLRDHRLQAWDLVNGSVLWQEAGAKDAHLWSQTPDGRQLVVGYSDLHLEFRDFLSGATNRQLWLDVFPHSLAFSPDSREFALFNEPANRLEIRDSQIGNLLAAWLHPGTARDIDWSPDGRQLATAGQDQKLYVWDRSHGQLRQTLRGHGSVVTRVKFLGDDVVGSSGWDGTLRLWDPRTGRPLLNAPGLAFNFDYNHATHRLGLQAADAAHLSPFVPSELRLYEVVRSDVTQELGEPGGPEWNGPWSVAFSPDERWLVSGSVDGVRCWDVARGVEVAHIPGGLTTRVAFSMAGRGLLTCSSKELLEWAIASGPAGEIVLGPPKSVGPSTAAKPFVEAAITPEGAVYAAVLGGRTQGFRNGTNFIRLTGSENFGQVAVSSDGRWLAGA